MGKRRNELQRQCRVCHCTDLAACATAEGACHWIEADLCSACAGVAIAFEIVEERFRQVEAEGYSLELDDAHRHGELAMAAAALASFSTYSAERRAGHRTLAWRSPLWPAGWAWKPKDRRRDLIRAGALIIAELERLDREARNAVEVLAGEWGRQAS
jgi:hypothetical protein